MTTTATDRSATGARRRNRALTVAAAVVLPVLIWLVADPIAGHDLIVDGGPDQDPVQVAAFAVVVLPLLVGLAGWGLLALLEKLTRHARVIWLVIAAVVLLVSFLPLTGAGTPGSTRAILGSMHLVVAAVLIVGLTRAAPTRR
jgi:hypothetical protein